jgi:hypothetical protein
LERPLRKPSACVTCGATVVYWSTTLLASTVAWQHCSTAFTCADWISPTRPRAWSGVSCIYTNIYKLTYYRKRLTTYILSYSIYLSC